MTIRDLIYEQQLYNNALRMQQILDNYSRQAQWLETDYLAIERALQILTELFISFSRYALEMMFDIHVTKSREALDVLHLKGIFDEQAYQQLNKMIGFRNVLVHDYLNLNFNLAIIQAIVRQKHYNLVTQQLQILLKCLEKT
jgi:uncharacterized protein YutE (UPF0331/DUF86 family)